MNTFTAPILVNGQYSQAALTIMVDDCCGELLDRIMAAHCELLDAGRESLAVEIEKIWCQFTSAYTSKSGIYDCAQVVIDWGFVFDRFMEICVCQNGPVDALTHLIKFASA